MQLNEDTGSNMDAHLINYVRFVDGYTIVEDFLFCKSITKRATPQYPRHTYDTK